MADTEHPELLSEEMVYRGRLLDIQIAKLRMPNGAETTRETISHPGAVCAVPVADDGRLYFVTQYRHAARERLLELPAGTLEPGEDPREAILRELQEEIGMLPGSIEPAGGFYVAPGYTSEFIHMFVCRGLTPSQLDGDEDEDIEVVAMSLTDALAAIDHGIIKDAKSIIGVLGWARRSLAP